MFESANYSKAKIKSHMQNSDVSDEHRKHHCKKKQDIKTQDILDRAESFFSPSSLGEIRDPSLWGLGVWPREEMDTLCCFCAVVGGRVNKNNARSEAGKKTHPPTTQPKHREYKILNVYMRVQPQGLWTHHKTQGEFTCSTLCVQVLISSAWQFLKKNQVSCCTN